VLAMALAGIGRSRLFSQSLVPPLELQWCFDRLAALSYLLHLRQHYERMARVGM
jgi:hypothetical protein